MSKDTDKALELFFEMLRNPAFQQDRLDLYKSQQLQEIERRNDRTEEIEAREWNRLLRGDKHFTSVFSTKASIESIDTGRPDRLSQNVLPAGPFCLCRFGRFQDGGDEGEAGEGDGRVEQFRRAGRQGSQAGFTPVPGVYMVNKPDVNQGRVSIGHLGILRGNPDEFALDMMNDILGGSGFTSRIMNRVRTDEGLAYDAGSSFAPGIYYEGQFRGGFPEQERDRGAGAQIVLDEIDRMRGEKVSARNWRPSRTRRSRCSRAISPRPPLLPKPLPQMNSPGAIRSIGRPTATRSRP